MKKTLEVFTNSLQDIHSLLNLANLPSEQINKIVVYRSAIVLMVASWEQFIEQLVQKSVLTLTNRIRDSKPVPEEVKQSVAKFSVQDNRSNLREFSNSVWSLSDKGWKKSYYDFCLHSTTELNTASSDNIKLLYWKILGIRDITNDWKVDELSPSDCVTKLDDLIDLRHDIAHGKNNRNSELNSQQIKLLINFLNSIATLTLNSVFSQISDLSRIRAITYNLKQQCFRQIIEYSATKSERNLTLDEIKRLGTSAQGNHKKLTFEPWGLLERIDTQNQRITDRLIDFYQGYIELPQKVFKFDNGDTIPDPDSPFIHFTDLP